MDELTRGLLAVATGLAVVFGSILVSVVYNVWVSDNRLQTLRWGIEILTEKRYALAIIAALFSAGYYLMLSIPDAS